MILVALGVTHIVQLLVWNTVRIEPLECSRYTDPLEDELSFNIFPPDLPGLYVHFCSRVVFVVIFLYD